MCSSDLAYWAQFDVDAIKRHIPIWGFSLQDRIEGNSARLLTQLLSALKAKATPAFKDKVARRSAVIRAEHAQNQRRSAQMASSPGSLDAINPHFLFALLGQAIRGHDVVLNEAIRNTMAVFEQIPRHIPGTLIGLPGGGLGFSGGTALGIKLAHPERRVIHVVGDGSFYFSNPSAMYAVSRQQNLPILTVLLDNGGWSAVKESTLDRKSTRLNSSHVSESRMPSSA